MPAIFNQILILDSLPVEEAGAVRRLFDDVSVQARAAAEAPAVVVYRVESHEHFAHVIGLCTQLAERDPYVPLVHLECHGSQEGLQFSDGSQATWSEVKRTLTPLNVATHLNLITVISACNGSHLAGTVEVTERAPVWGFIGPNRVMGAYELERAFSDFYRTLIATQSSEEAAEAMRATAEAGTFMVMSSETIFRLVLEGYQENFGSEAAVLARAHALQAQAQAIGVDRPVAEIVAMLMDPAILERFRRTFFMIDLYPEHENRFSALPR